MSTVSDLFFTIIKEFFANVISVGKKSQNLVKVVKGRPFIAIAKYCKIVDA